MPSINFIEESKPITKKNTAVIINDNIVIDENELGKEEVRKQQDGDDHYDDNDDGSTSSDEDEVEELLQTTQNFSPIKPNSPHQILYNTTEEYTTTVSIDQDQFLTPQSSVSSKIGSDLQPQPPSPQQQQQQSHQTTFTEESDGQLDLNHLPETVSVLKAQGNKTVYLVGTSHFSKESHRDVRRVIRTVRPRVVILELCQSRMCFLTMNEKEIMSEAKSLDFTKIMDYVKKNGMVQGFIYTLLLSASAKITNDLDMAPGGEFRNAFNEALKIPGCSILLGDRPINITLRRAIATLSTWQKIKMTWNCLFSNEKLSQEELEKYKQKDILEQLIDELAQEFPGLSRVMVQERDAYLAYSLWNACNSTEPDSTLVGVVGIGHAAGIKSHWENAKEIDIGELGRIPESRPSKTFMVIKYSVYGLLAYGVCRFMVPNVVKDGLRSVTASASEKIIDVIRKSSL